MRRPTSSSRRKPACLSTTSARWLRRTRHSAWNRARRPRDSIAPAIDHLGIREAARRAWRRHLEIESEDDWAGEGLQRLAKTNRPVENFRAELERSYDALSRGNAATARDLVVRFPQEARSWGEAEILARWGEAILRLDTPDAARHLAVARSMAQALSGFRGERLLATAIDDLQRATERQRMTAATAMITNRAGRIAYAGGEPGKAEPLLRRVTTELEDISPSLSLNARYFLANAVFDQYRASEARRELEVVLSRLRPEQKALRAQALWELGQCDFASARWRRSELAFAESAALFESLGETRNAAFLHGLLADVHERLGDFRTAWRERLIALEGLAPIPDMRFRAALSGTTRTAMFEHDWRAAASLVKIELELAPTETPDDLYVDTLLRQSLIARRNGDRALAREAVRHASVAAKAIADPALRARLEADLQFAGALLREEDSPSAAIRELTNAIAFHQLGGRRMYLPEIRLARARVHRANGNRSEAWADLVSAMNELESQRDDAPTGYARVAVFDSAREVFTDAITLQLEEGDAPAALECADRFRARVLLDEIGPRDRNRTSSPSALNVATIPPDTAVVAYVVVAGRLLAFVVRNGEVSHIDIAVDSSQLAKLSSAFLLAVSRDLPREVRRLSEALHPILLEPLMPLLGDAQKLVVVPDATLQQLPWAALSDPQTHRFLVEDRAIVVAPSLSVYLRASTRSFSRSVSEETQVLVVGAPLRPDVERLDEANREASEVAALYPSAVVLRGAEATREAFLARIRTADIVHFAGHAMAPREGPDARLLFAGEGTEGLVLAGDLAELDLTRTRLAVLAACSTAAGELHAGEGAWSVARSFLSAGVPSVVAALWPIDDAESRELFVAFHQHLRRDGRTTAEALRAAQLDAIRRRVPMSTWAAIQVNGS